MEPLLEALREKLVEAEKRAAVAEAVAAERQRIIAAQEQTLRMLEAPKQAVQQPAPVSEAAAGPDQATPPEPTKRRWWTRSPWS
ncbi:hypothetical protein [Arthrobacter sp. TE12231]